MAITADFTDENGVTHVGAVFKVRNCYVSQKDEVGVEGDPDHEPKVCHMPYNIDVWHSAAARDAGASPLNPHHWQRGKISPAPTTDAVVAAYGNLKACLEADPDVVNVVDI